MSNYFFIIFLSSPFRYHFPVQLFLYYFLLYIFLASGGGSPLYLEILQYNIMILQRIRIIAVDAGFEPGTSAPEVWRATNEPPHLYYFLIQSFPLPFSCPVISLLFSYPVLSVTFFLSSFFFIIFLSSPFCYHFPVLSSPYFTIFLSSPLP